MYPSLDIPYDFESQLQGCLHKTSIDTNDNYFSRLLYIDIKRKIDCLRLFVRTTSAASFKAFFAAAINSTNETKKAGGKRH
jgi:hypothetical protein